MREGKWTSENEEEFRSVLDVLLRRLQGRRGDPNSGEEYIPVKGV